MNYLTIGQMAKINQISSRALRVYQDAGLITPEHVDENTKRRYYDVHQSSRLDLIVHLQQMGFSLEAIREIVESQDVEELRRRVLAQQQRIIDKQRELRLAEHAAESLVESCSLYLERPALGKIFLERLPQRKVTVFDMPSMPTDLPYEIGSSGYYEWLFREVKAQVVEKGLPLTFFHDVCSFYDDEILSGRSKEIRRCFVTIPGDEHFGNLANFEQLPGGMHLVVYLDKAYSEGKNDIDVSYEWLVQMMEYADSNDMEPCADGFGELLCRYPRMITSNLDDMLFRLCIPVRAKKKQA